MKGIERAELRPVQRGDLAQLREWRNSEHIRKMMYTDHHIQPEEHEDWFERQAASSPPTAYGFILDGALLGQVNISTASHGRATWGYYIGPEAAPKGAGTIMGFLALDLIFRTRGLRRLDAEALSDNEPSIRFLARLGFRHEGTLREYVVKQGLPRDVSLFAILSREWEARRDYVAEKIFREILPNL